MEGEIMSKYNNYKSIPVDSLSKEELSEAIHEWAEGSKALERLLLLCYHNNIKTVGSHIIDGNSYLQFNYNEEREKLERIFNTVIRQKNSDLFFNPGPGNPFSGPEWDLPTLSIGYYPLSEEEINRNYDVVSYNLLNEEKFKDNFVKQLFNFAEHCNNKNSNISFRLRNIDNNYIFTIESSPILDEEFDRLNDAFTSSGLEEVELSREFVEDNRHHWKIEDSNLNLLIEKVNKSISEIIKKDVVKAPTSEEEVLDFNRRAKFKKDNMRNTPIGEMEFDKWLMSERERLYGPREEDNKIR